MADDLLLKFRRATASDAATLFALEQRVAVPRLYEPRASISEALKEIVGNALFLIEVEGHTIGSVSLRSIEGGAIYIANMAVDPQHRRRGIARAAIAFVLDMTWEASRWELITHPDNAAAIRLYRSFGFRGLDEDGGHHLCNGEPFIRLVRERDHTFPSAARSERNCGS